MRHSLRQRTISSHSYCRTRRKKYVSPIISIQRWNRHMEEMMQIIRERDWSRLLISLKTGVVATIISLFLGIIAARKVVKASPGKKAVIYGILTLPMVLPPTVAGFFLRLLFSRR